MDRDLEKDIQILRKLYNIDDIKKSKTESKLF